MCRMFAVTVGVMAMLCSASGFAWAEPAQTPAKSAPAPAKMESAKAARMESAKMEKAVHSMAKSPRHAMMARERVHLSKDEVTALQNALASAGAYKGKVDGIFGRHTRVALRKYQKEHGLAASGRPDPETVSKLGITVAAEHMSPPSPPSHKANSASNAAAKKP